MNTTEVNTEIDDSLYSRQRYVLGDGAMQKLSLANVLVVGLGGVGIEIAKNVILAGVKSLTLYDPSVATLEDLGTQFFLREEDIKNNSTRADACMQRLAELNPYVKVEILDVNLFDNITCLKKFQCVVVSELLFHEQLIINQFCRLQVPAIPYISSDVHGVFSYLFCDFGDSFLVNDVDGEEGKEVMIQSITKDNPSTVTTLEYCRHNLETNNTITFREIIGMDELNGKTFQIKYVNPYAFTINCDTRKYKNYQHGGVFIKQKDVASVKFTSLEEQLKKPDLLMSDLSKLDAPIYSLVNLAGLHEYLKENSVQNINYDDIYKIVQNLSSTFEMNGVDQSMLKCLIQTCRGKLAPLCASIGGIAAQEVLKAVSGKFSPLKQWLMLDAVEIMEDGLVDEQINTQSGRYSSLNYCLPKSLVEKLRQLKLFMVGCGAIGCEMLKNFALLGVSVGQDGNLTITDNDLIEKSNLNRQFLFRPWHLQKAKSTTAAEASKEINPDLHITPHQNKVSVETQDSIYTDNFFSEQDIVVNALDNIEARRYVDSRCVANKRPLLETGTMATKGHVQVIVPFITESYSNQRDPIDDEVPYCTLKSFPQVIEHTIQWARDKFENLFTIKPNDYNTFWEKHKSPSDLFEKLHFNSSIPDGFVNAIRLIQKQPDSIEACLSLARIKFEQYFNHKALQLLHTFPLDTKLPDGSWFWQSPKRPPTPLKFDISDSTHKTFVVAYAKLLAKIYNVNFQSQSLHDKALEQSINSVIVPEFVPSSKVSLMTMIGPHSETLIRTSRLQSVVRDFYNVYVALETIDGGKEMTIEVSDQDKEKDTPKEQDTDKITKLKAFIKHNHSDIKLQLLLAEHFEKDDDSNGHIDFITAASNLRAAMYNIEPADRFKTKRIAGKIIPAIATTTAAIAGLASIELLKVISKKPIEKLKNCFLNLALPMMVLSEPGAASKTKITDGLEYTAWDHWEVHGNATYTLKDFIQHFMDKYKLEVSIVCKGVKMIYVPFMPGHKKRTTQTMSNLLKPGKDEEYVDLVISFKNEKAVSEEDDDLTAPPVRYFF